MLENFGNPQQMNYHLKLNELSIISILCLTEFKAILDWLETVLIDGAYIHLVLYFGEIIEITTLPNNCRYNGRPRLIPL